MHHGLPGQLGVEGDADHAAARHRDHLAAVPGQHRDALAHARHHGGADEGRAHRGPVVAPREHGLLGGRLGAERVAGHRDVQDLEGALAGGRVLDAGGEQDQPGARAQGRQAAEHGVAQRVAQPEQAQQPVHGGGLPAGQHQRVQPGELLGRLHEHGLGAELTQHRGVLGDPALQGEDADPGRGAHQPRSASRCGAGRSPTLIPTIASPSPREASAIFSGSS